MAGEIEGEVLMIDHSFYLVGINHIRLFVQGSHQACHLDARRLLKTLHQPVEVLRIDQRLISLQIHDNIMVQIQILHYPCHPITASGQRGRGHDCLTAKFLHRFPNSDVIGGNQHPLQFFRLSGTFIHPLNQWFTTNIDQRLAWQPYRGITGGTHTNGFQGCSPLQIDLTIFRVNLISGKQRDKPAIHSIIHSFHNS